MACSPRPLTELDAFYLRFLRARHFDRKKSVLMLEKYLEWRKIAQVKNIVSSVRFPWILALRSLYPHNYFGVDRAGRPIYIERLGRIDSSSLLKLSTLDMLLAYWVQQYEFLRTVILPSCSIAAGRNISQGTTILDLEGLSITNVGAQQRSIIQKLAHLSQNYFPELLGAMVIVNAPSILAPIWTFIKSLLDESTVAKINLITCRSTHWKEYLQQLADPSQLPDFLGGTAPSSNWASAGIGPWKDEAILAKVEERYPHIPKSFIRLDLTSGTSESLEVLSSSNNNQTRKPNQEVSQDGGDDVHKQQPGNEHKQ